MFIVFRRDNGELTYTADAEALEHLDAEVYDWVEAPSEDWAQTHYWNPHDRVAKVIPTEV